MDDTSGVLVHASHANGVCNITMKMASRGESFRAPPEEEDDIEEDCIIVVVDVYCYAVRL